MGQPAEAEAASLLDNNAAPPPQRPPRKAVVAGVALLAAVAAATARATRPAPRLASNAMDIAVTGPYGANTAAQYPFLASGRYDALVEPHASTELRVAGAPRSAAAAVGTKSCFQPYAPSLSSLSLRWCGTSQFLSTMTRSQFVPLWRSPRIVTMGP
jgi:hypothetical protein